MNIFFNRYFVIAIGVILYIFSIYLIIVLPNIVKLLGLALFIFMIYITEKQNELVRPGECIVVERNGKREALMRGLHFVLFHPDVDFIKMPLSLKEIALDPQNFKAATKDNVNLTLDEVVIKIKIINPVEVAFNFTKYDEKIPGMVRGELRKIIKELDAEDILRKRDEIAAEAKKALVEELKKKHIELLGIIIKKIFIPPDIEKTIERKAQAKYENDIKILEAQTKLRVTEEEARIEQILNEATFETINKLVKESGDKADIPIEFLLGKNYLSVMEKLMNSKNSKFVLYPTDKKQSFRDLYSATRLDKSLRNSNTEEDIDEDTTNNETQE